MLLGCGMGVLGAGISSAGRLCRDGMVPAGPGGLINEDERFGVLKSSPEQVRRCLGKPGLLGSECWTSADGALLFLSSAVAFAGLNATSVNAVCWLAPGCISSMTFPWFCSDLQVVAPQHVASVNIGWI